MNSSNDGLNEKPYLSIVAASRNDDHGGNPLIRTQIFINTLARQCERYRLPAELIIVDWNPVDGLAGLAAVLTLPAHSRYCHARVLTVPSSLHQRLKYAEALPLFQMIAKNVGIRRAQGQFVLATNIDIIFSNELMQFIAKQSLDTQKLYRVDRNDIPSGLTKEASLDEVVHYAWTNPIRVHRRHQPEDLVKQFYGEELFPRKCQLNGVSETKQEGVQVLHNGQGWEVRPDRSVDMTHLHTNACGDFTLLSRQGWMIIRGYPEFEAYSFNIDSMGMISAHYAGFEEVSLLPPCVCFHIEHQMGSGWSPEGGKILFDRLRRAGVLSPEWPVLRPLVNEMREKRKALQFNNSQWGLAAFDLPEQTLGETEPISSDKLSRLAIKGELRKISAIQPDYDLDRLTLAYERLLNSNGNEPK